MLGASSNGLANSNRGSLGPGTEIDAGLGGLGLNTAYAGLTPTASAITLPAVSVTANVPGVLSESYDPAASQRWMDGQRAAYTQNLGAEDDSRKASLEALAVNARNAQRAQDEVLTKAKGDAFFHEQTIDLVTAPAQAVWGFIKDVPNQVNRLGITLDQGARFQAAQSAQNGAYLRGDPNADALGNALRASTFHDLATPVEDLYSLTPIQKIGSQAIGLTLAFDPVIAFARGPAVVQRFTNGAGDLANAFDRTTSRVTVIDTEAANPAAPFSDERVSVSKAAIPPYDAASTSARFQGDGPYWGVDHLQNTSIAQGSYVVQLTHTADGQPVGSYFMSLDTFKSTELVDGSYDANVLNQGLQTYPGGRPNFRPYAQVYQLTDDVPMGGAATGPTTANPYFNPGQYETLDQLFILPEFQSSLKPERLFELSNTTTPNYPPLNEITNNMLRTDTQ